MGVSWISIDMMHQCCRSGTVGVLADGVMVQVDTPGFSPLGIVAALHSGFSALVHLVLE